MASRELVANFCRDSEIAPTEVGFSSGQPNLRGRFRCRAAGFGNPAGQSFDLGQGGTGQDRKAIGRENGKSSGQWPVVSDQ